MGEIFLSTFLADATLSTMELFLAQIIVKKNADFAKVPAKYGFALFACLTGSLL